MTRAARLGRQEAPDLMDSTLVNQALEERGEHSDVLTACRRPSPSAVGELS